MVADTTFHECGLPYYDEANPNVRQRDLIDVGLEMHNERIVVRRLKRGIWRAYLAEIVGSYSLGWGRGGACLHTRVRVLRDLMGDSVEASTLGDLIRHILTVPGVEPGFSSDSEFHKWFSKATSVNPFKGRKAK